jgi:hypothetical protein
MTHVERLIAELNQLRPLSEWGIDKLHILELISIAKALDEAVAKLNK